MTGLNPVDEEARGRFSLQWSRKVAEALRNGIQVGGRHVWVEWEGPSHDDQPRRKPKGGYRGATRAREGKGKGKGFGQGLRCYGCASTCPWFLCKLVK